MSDLSSLMKAPGAGFEADDDFERINALYVDKGWSDGLPIVPPTAARAAQQATFLLQARRLYTMPRAPARPGESMAVRPRLPGSAG